MAGFVIMVGVLVGLAAAAMPAVKTWLKPEPPQDATTVKREVNAELADAPNSIRLPADVAKKLGVDVATVAQAREGRPLKLEGSLARGEGEVPLTLAEVAGGFGDEDAGQFVNHVAGGEGGFGPVQVGVRVGPVTGESIEPAEDPFASGDILLPAIVV